jgi:hypothetical protein
VRSGRKNVAPDSIELLGPPQRQMQRIDILFDAKVSGYAVRFLIEDKTETSHHSGQLQRYREAMGDARVAPLGRFDRPSTDNRGKNESEIAVLYFDETSNTPNGVLSLLPAIHEAFVAGIADGLRV